jgi:hypothetical protein
MDHFRPPLSTQRHWESFHAAWAGALADFLNEDWLPEGYFAEEQVHPSARVEIDVATFEQSGRHPREKDEGAVATLSHRVWSPPQPAMIIPAYFLEGFEVQIIRTEGGPTVVAAIELVSPGNKDRPEHRRAFATKCASYLHQGISLAVIDIVTTRQANLHDELVELMGKGGEYRLAAGTELYAVGYRPVRRDDGEQIDVWPAALALGAKLPTVPLAISSDFVVPIDLETSYSDACRRRRLS